VRDILWIDVDQFHGIEYEEFPARIAEVAMWLVDHQMNMMVSEEFGQYFVRLPLKKSAHIVIGNALQLDWKNVVAKEQLSYIFGNPPFVGKHLQNEEQKADMERVFSGVNGSGVLDYVAAWYVKAADYIQGTAIKVAFVSTNSVSQGEQTGVLWNLMFSKYNVKIHFAHRTFNWTNEARGKAAVHVVIIGFANNDSSAKFIYEYEDIKGEPHEVRVKNISPYLFEGKDLVVLPRTNPLTNDVPKMINGSKPVDDGNFFFTDEEKKEFIKQEPKSAKYFKPILSSHEFLNGKPRWCLWLEKIEPSELKLMPLVKERVDNVRKFREKSPKESVRRQAATPTLFSEIRQPKSNYIIIPRHSSEQRKYVPFGFFSPSTIASDSCIALPNASLYHFGILSSEMHNVWLKYTCGRIKSDYRYSNVLVYNNYPFPNSVSEKHVAAIETAAQKVLDARAKHPNESLADLYDPNTMPPDLVKAHQQLDKAVDLAYRSQPFTSESKRMEFLFDLYEKYKAGLFAVEKQKRKTSIKA
jgi:hypothetical protein